MPEVDSSLSVTLTVPDGTSKGRLVCLSDEIMTCILEIDAVETVGALSGSSGNEGTLMLEEVVIIRLHFIYC